MKELKKDCSTCDFNNDACAANDAAREAVMQHKETCGAWGALKIGVPYETAKQELITVATKRVKYPKTGDDLIAAAMVKLTAVEDRYIKNGQFQEKGCWDLADALEKLESLYRQYPKNKMAREVRQTLRDYNWIRE